MNFDPSNIETLKRREETQKNAAFDKWMSEPLVRMSISSIPAGEQKDALQMLLRSAFESGHGSGSGSTMGMVIEALLTGQSKRDNRP